MHLYVLDLKRKGKVSIGPRSFYSPDNKLDDTFISSEVISVIMRSS